MQHYQVYEYSARAASKRHEYQGTFVTREDAYHVAKELTRGTKRTAFVMVVWEPYIEAEFKNGEQTK